MTLSNTSAVGQETSEFSPEKERRAPLRRSYSGNPAKAAPAWARGRLVSQIPPAPQSAPAAALWTGGARQGWPKNRVFW